MLALVVYLAVKVTPAYVNNYQLHDKMQTVARFGVVNRTPEDEMRDTILREIRDLGIPAKREDIHIEASPRDVRISVSYTVVVDLPGYQLKLHFNPTADNRAMY